MVASRLWVKSRKSESDVRHSPTPFTAFSLKKAGFNEGDGWYCAEARKRYKEEGYATAQLQIGRLPID